MFKWIWNKVKHRASSDKFRLDVGRIVFVDGHEYIIKGFQSTGSYQTKPDIVVEFQASTKYLKENVL